jgi:hypothetical protein
MIPRNFIFLVKTKDPDISIRGDPVGFLEKKIGFQNNLFFKKIKRKAKITKHDKKKSDKDEIGNILLIYQSIT